MKATAKWMTNQLLIWNKLVCMFLFSISHPVIHQYLISGISPRLIAMESVMISLSTIIVNSLFIKYAERVFRYMPLLLLAETGIYATICPSIHFGLISARMYYLIEITTVAIITRNLSCCGNRIRRILYAGEEREKYDTCVPIADAIAVIAGGSIAMIGIPLHWAWIVVMAGVIADDIFLMIIWLRLRKGKAT